MDALGQGVVAQFKQVVVRVLPNDAIIKQALEKKTGKSKSNIVVETICLISSRDRVQVSIALSCRITRTSTNYLVF